MTRSMLPLLGLVAGCNPVTTDVDIRVLFPEDEAPLTSVDNVSVSVAPRGLTETVPAAGTEFELQLEFEPDDQPRILSMFLASGETLVAWGRTPPFTFSGAQSARISVFTPLVERFSNFPRAFADPDPDTLAAATGDFGFVALASDGSAVFLDGYTLEIVAAQSLEPEGEGFAPDDGAFVSDALGGVMRVGWDEGLLAYRFSAQTNRWTRIPYGAADLVGSRPGAAHGVDPEGTLLWLFGGAQRRDVVEVPLVPRTDDEADDGRDGGDLEGELDVRQLQGVTLDGPRPGATAVLFEPGDPRTSVVIGGEDPALPWVYAVEDGSVHGDVGAWTAPACIRLGSRRILCVGGQRSGEPTSAGLLVTRNESDIGVEVLPDLFPVPVSDPIWLDGPSAVYAQGEGRWIRVDRETLEVTEGEDEVLRARGGVSVAFGTGASYLVGGVDLDDTPVDRWQVFVPPPGP